ncbi:MAG: metallophosphoesterase family protein [Chitinophagales bacterium]
MNLKAATTARRTLVIYLILLSASVTIAQQGTGNRMSSTNLPFNDDTGKLQFAIISDVWGGRRPGVFEDAVEKLQLLQPQFVISVGDLTDGKTYDTAVIERQWQEFNADIKPLGMRFFYVPGNHDIGNPLMEQQWKKYVGPPYYHFVYKNVLFLCINTEDGGHGGIRDEQVNYFKKAIADNAGVRWTFLFMHRPVWQGRNEREEGFEKIEALLKGNNYTLFSGHHHTYVKMMKNGNKYFVLGSTGGGSDLRGEKFGEYDHLTIVTLTSGEPRIVNLKLQGIIKEDVVNDTTYSITQALIDQTWLHPVSLVSEHQQEKALTAEIKLDNPTDYPLKVTGQLCDKKQYLVTPCEINAIVEPHQTITQPITISKKDNSLVDLADLPFVDISLMGEYSYKNTSYSITANKRLLLSWKLVPLESNNTNPARQVYHGQDTSGMIAVVEPEQLDGRWYWSGPGDVFFRFKLIKDSKLIHLVVLVNDDQWINDPSKPRDLLFLYVEDSAGRQILLTISPGDGKITIEGKGSIGAKDIKTKRYFSDSILMMDITLPAVTLTKTDNSVRVNIGYRDQDNFPEKTSATLYWKPIWGSDDDYKNSGTFLLK